MRNGLQLVVLRGMIMDLLDALKPKVGYVLSGTYREKYKDSPLYFEYDVVDSPRWSFGEIINNLIRDDSAYVIRTMEPLPWKKNGFVITQDGKAWRITEKIKHSTTHNKDVLRLVKENPSTEWVLAMVSVENPMELQ